MESGQTRVESEGTLESAGGIRIFFRSWRPSATPHGVVAIIPGFNSHSGYYTWVGNQLASRNLAVYAVDLRGRGKSDGERFYVEKFADYLSDIAAFIALAKSREPGLPVFLLGHSAGGVLASLYALDHPGELAGLISESFAFELPAPDFALAVLKGLSQVAPHAHVLHLKNEDFSRDPSVQEMLNADPLIAHETQPTRTVAELVRADERLKKEFRSIRRCGSTKEASTTRSTIWTKRRSSKTSKPGSHRSSPNSKIRPALRAHNHRKNEENHAESHSVIES